MTGGCGDLTDDPETNPDGDPIINRRDVEWWRLSYVYFMAIRLRRNPE